MTNLETSLDHQTGSLNQQKMSSVPEPRLQQQQLRHPRDLETKQELKVNPEITKLNKSNTKRTENTPGTLSGDWSGDRGVSVPYR